MEGNIPVRTSPDHLSAVKTAQASPDCGQGSTWYYLSLRVSFCLSMGYARLLGEFDAHR